MPDHALESAFGQPDGFITSIDSSSDGYVELPARFGGIARDPTDARVRVVVGQLGTGKSLYLRRMQDATHTGNDSVYSDTVRLNSELTSEDLAAFAHRLRVRGSSEHWKVLWRRAITRSALSHVRTSGHAAGVYSDETRIALDRHVRLTADYTSPRSPTQAAKDIIREHEHRTVLDRYLHDHAWADVEHLLATALRNGRPMFIYLDHLDNNFRWAPSLWTDCQVGLFYAVMDLLREDTLRNKLHVVIAIREMTYAVIKASEHAPRYLDPTHINLMSWDRRSMSFLLHRKLERLPAGFFVKPDDRSLSSWLGFDRVLNSRPRPGSEDVESYMLRHTRLVPRDLITMGNRLCHDLHVYGREDFDQEMFREAVAQCAADSARSQIAQVANQIQSDLMPDDATGKEYDHIYLRPNEYVLRSRIAEIIDCIDATKTEVLTRDAIDALNERGREVFGMQTHLADILWQYGLIGSLLRRPRAGEAVQFFSITRLGESSGELPISPTGTWVWHPILFDVAHNLEPTLTTALWITDSGRS